jgi:hypothetical protein
MFCWRSAECSGLIASGMQRCVVELCACPCCGQPGHASGVVSCMPACLPGTQVFCYEDSKLLKLFSDIVRILYDADVIAEDTIMWCRSPGSNPTPCAVLRMPCVLLCPPPFAVAAFGAGMRGDPGEVRIVARMFGDLGEVRIIGALRRAGPFAPAAQGMLRHAQAGEHVLARTGGTRRARTPRGATCSCATWSPSSSGWRRPRRTRTRPESGAA